MAENKRRVSISIDPKVDDLVCNSADKTGLKKSTIYEKAVRNYFEEKRGQETNVA